MKLVIDVALCANKTGSIPARSIPRGFRPAYRREDRHAAVFAIWGLHWILRAAHDWHWRRWTIELWLFYIGWMVEGDHDEAPRFRSLKFGNPIRIIAERAVRARAAGRDAGRYEINRAVQDAYAQGYSDAHRTFTRAIEDLKIDVGLLRYRIEHGHDPVPVTPGLAALESEIERTR